MAIALLLLGGCMDPETRQQIKDSNSLLAPIFQQTSYVDAATWAGDQFDPDKKARGTTLLANAPFGGEEVYVNLYRLHVADQSPNVRIAAARALGTHGTPDDVPRLLPLLKDEQPAVRFAAVRALQRLHNPAAIDPLIGLLTVEKESEADIRAEASGALGQYAEPRVLQALIAALADDSLLVTANAKASLETLTGQSELGDERKAWVVWLDQNKQPFAGRRAYVYPVFERDKRWLDYVPFMPSVPNERAAEPVGMPTVGSGTAAPPSEVRGG